MTRLEELTSRYFPPDSNTTQVRHDNVLEFGAKLIEECAKIAEYAVVHYDLILESGMAECAEGIASAIRSLALEAKR